MRLKADENLTHRRGRTLVMNGADTNEQDVNRKMQHIESRTAQLQPLRSKYAEEAMRFLFLVNSGGAAATLGYLGTGTGTADHGFAKWVLACFVLGIVFIGCVRWILMVRSYRYCDAWEQKAPACAQTEEEWAQFLEDDKKRTAGHRWEFIFGHLSIVSLLGGLILGALGLIL
jgi:hypothetical protein